MRPAARAVPRREVPALVEAEPSRARGETREPVDGGAVTGDAGEPGEADDERGAKRARGGRAIQRCDARRRESGTCRRIDDAAREALRSGRATLAGDASVAGLSIRFPVMPPPLAGKAMTPLGGRLNSSSLRRKGAARPWRSQSGLQTTWWTPLRSAHWAAMRSTPGPLPWRMTMSAYLARALSR